jgi:hypothetical protein
MTKLAEAIAHEEGYYVEGSLPQRNNNPGDLRHGNGEVHPDNQPNAVGAFATPEDGWAALERQLALDSGRDWTVEQLVYSYAPPTENNTAEYLAYVCSYLKCDPQMLVSDALKIT